MKDSETKIKRKNDPTHLNIFKSNCDVFLTDEPHTFATYSVALSLFHESYQDFDIVEMGCLSPISEQCWNIF